MKNDSEKQDKEDQNEAIKNIEDLEEEALDFVYSEVSKARWNQRRLNDSLDKKGGTLLGFMGVILTLLIGGVFQFKEIILRWPLFYKYIILSSLICLGLSIFFDILAIDIRGYKNANRPETLIDNYLKRGEDSSYTKLKVTTSRSEAYHDNCQPLKRRAWFLQIALWLLTIGLAASIGLVVHFVCVKMIL